MTEKVGNDFPKFLKRSVSPLPWVLLLNAQISMLDVLTGLSEGVSEELAWAGSAPPQSRLCGSCPGLITVCVIQFFFMERLSFPAAVL